MTRLLCWLVPIVLFSCAGSSEKDNGDHDSLSEHDQNRVDCMAEVLSVFDNLRTVDYTYAERDDIGRHIYIQCMKEKYERP